MNKVTAKITTPPKPGNISKPSFEVLSIWDLVESFNVETGELSPAVRFKNDAGIIATDPRNPLNSLRRDDLAVALDILGFECPDSHEVLIDRLLDPQESCGWDLLYRNTRRGVGRVLSASCIDTRVAYLLAAALEVLGKLPRFEALEGTLGL